MNYRKSEVFIITRRSFYKGNIKETVFLDAVKIQCFGKQENLSVINVLLIKVHL